jgi:prolyl 4-hydroxylase
LSGDKQELYERYIQQCDLAAQEENRREGLPLDPHFCTFNDKYRIQMNREQPASVYNYTKLGYQKIRAPPRLFQLIQDFYQRNKHRASIEWSSVNTYQNMWEYPSTMVRIENSALEGGGSHLYNQITAEAQKVLEEWVGQKLTPVSLYGVREYHRGSLLAPHVDRMPLITSAISTLLLCWTCVCGIVALTRIPCLTPSVAFISCNLIYIVLHSQCGSGWNG